MNSDYNARDSTEKLLYQSHRISNNHKLSCKVKKLIMALLEKKI
ncbi:hypothetical protein ACP8HZ_07165 [Francisella noatunensis]